MIVSKQQKKKGNSVIFSSIVVQSLWYVQILVNPWIIACQASLSFTISQSLLKFVSTESVMLSNFLILCHSLLLLPSIFSSIVSLVFGFCLFVASKLALHIRWPEFWNFSFNSSICNGYLVLNFLELTGLISLLSKGLSRVFSSTTI